MLQKSKRVIALLASLLLCVSMLTVIVLPAYADVDPAETDAYARIHATLQPDGTYLPGANAIFVSQTGFGAGTFQYTYGDGSTWGDGKTYTLTAGLNAFTTLQSAVLYLQAARGSYAGTNADYDGIDTIVCAPGTYAGNNFQNNALVTFPAPVDEEGEPIVEPTVDDYFHYYILGPQAGKTPVDPDGSEKVMNGRTDDTKTEAVATSTVWAPKNAVLTVDGFAAKGAFKVYQTGTEAGALYGLELRNMYYHGTSGTQQLFQYANKTANSALYLRDVYMMYDNVDANQTNNSIYSSIIVWDKVYMNRRNMDNLADQYSQSHQMQIRPATAAATAVGLIEPGKKAAMLSVTNCTFDSNPGAHLFRFYFDAKDYAGFGPDSIRYTFKDNHFLNSGADRGINKYNGGNTAITGCTDTISFNSLATSKTDLQNNALNFTFENNLLEFTSDVMSTRASGTSFFNFVDTSSANSVQTWNFSHNTIKNSGERPIYYATNNALHIDFSSWLVIDQSNNIASSSQYTGYNLTYDNYVSDEFKGGVNETFTLASGKDMVIYNSTINQIIPNGKVPKDNPINGTIKIVPYENAGTYPVDQLFKFRGEKVEIVGLYTDAACTNELTEANPNELDGAVLVARYKGIKTVCTVPFTITVAPDSEYVFVDHSASVTSYNYNGKNFTLSAANRFATVKEAAASGKSVIVLLPGEYVSGTNGEANFTVDGRDFCIIGPMLGINPNDKDDISKANPARGLIGSGAGATIDTTKEALFCLAVTLKGGSNEMAVDGIAAGKGIELYPYNYQNYQAGKANGQADAYLSDSSRVLGVTVNNVLLNGRNGGNAVISGQGSVGTTMKYFNSKRFGYINNMRVEGPAGTASVISSGLNNAEVTNSYFYGLNGIAFQVHASNMEYVKVKPVSTGLKIQGCYFDECTPTKCNFIYPNYVDTFVDTSWGQSPNANLDCMPGGAYAIIDGNTFNNISVVPNGTSNNYILRLTNGSPYADGLVALTVTNNIVKAKEATSAKFVDMAGGGTPASADFSGNQFYNFTNPLNLHQIDDGNNMVTNIDENYYAMIVDGKPVVTPLPEKLDPYVEKSDWYYLDPEMTVKDTDFACDVSAISSNAVTKTIGYWTIEGNLSCGTTSFAASDIKAKGDATVVGIYKDAACTVAEPAEITDTAFFIKTKVGTTEQVFAAGFVAAPAHNYSASTVITEPTCTEDGLEERTCQNCGKVDQHVLDALGHQSGPMEAHQATCTENAGVFSSCIRCGLISSGMEIPDTALGHDWGEDIVVKAGSCTVDREIKHTCNRCGETENVITPAPGHSFGDWKLFVKETCEKDGIQRRVCGTCGAYEDIPVPALGHDYQNVTVDPTCVADGRSVNVCTRCNTEQAGSEVILPATGIHTWGNTFTNAATCSMPGTEQRFCTVCGCIDEATYKEFPIDPFAHQFADDDWTIVTEGNCVTATVKQHNCVLCGTLVTEKDDSMVTGAHKYDTVTTAATFDQAGKVEKICSVCGDTVLDKILPRLPKFTDVKGNEWFFESLQTVTSLGIIKGYSDGSFKPSANVSRAEAVTMMSRLAGVDTTKYSTAKFTDVAKKAWYNGAVAWAEKSGIVGGKSESTFDPDGNITRQELVTILVRYAKHAGVTLEVKNDKVKFADDSKIASYAKTNVYLCQQAGLVSGKPGNLFDPNGNATRAEFCKILAGFIADYK